MMRMAVAVAVTDALCAEEELVHEQARRGSVTAVISRERQERECASGRQRANNNDYDDDDGLLATTVKASSPFVVGRSVGRSVGQPIVLDAVVNTARRL